MDKEHDRFDNVRGTDAVSHNSRDSSVLVDSVFARAQAWVFEPGTLVSLLFKHEVLCTIPQGNYDKVTLMPCAIRCPNLPSTLANSLACLVLITSDVAKPRCPTTLPTKLSWSRSLIPCHCTDRDLSVCASRDDGYKTNKRKKNSRRFLARQNQSPRQWRDTSAPLQPNYDGSLISHKFYHK